MGMDSICANALSSIFPMVFVVLFSVMINLILYFLFKVSSVHALFSKFLCYIFKNIQNDFLKGFLYTFLLHFFWALGFHGSHLLEPVVDSVFTNISSDLIFSKSFFDTYIVMGGCGTTICVFLIYLIFYRKTRFANISKIVKGMMGICCNSHSRGFLVQNLGCISRAKILNTHTLNMPM